jgi:hypothetical protein
MKREDSHGQLPLSLVPMISPPNLTLKLRLLVPLDTTAFTDALNPAANALTTLYTLNTWNS